MPKLKKINLEEARAAFHKFPKMEIVAAPFITEKLNTIQNSPPISRKTALNLEKMNKINTAVKAGEMVRRPRTLSPGLRIWTRKYLDGAASVRDFERWRKAKPNEALPWAWKVTYGDGQQGSTVTVNRVNTLIQILTGQQLSPQGCQDNQLPQAVVSQTIDTQAVMVIDNPVDNLLTTCGKPVENSGNYPVDNSENP